MLARIERARRAVPPPPEPKYPFESFTAAEASLRSRRGAQEVALLVAAGRAGLHLATAMTEFQPFMRWATAPRGVLNRIPPETDPDEYERLLARLEPSPPRHAELAPLLAIGSSALKFVETYETLRAHAEFLSAMLAKPGAKRAFRHLRRKKQMVAAAVMLTTELAKLKPVTPHEMTAVAVMVLYTDDASVLAEDASATLDLVKAWDSMMRKVRRDVLPVLRDLLKKQNPDPSI